MVMMWPSKVLLRKSTIEASVVDLPEPVGPVTRIRPFSLSQSWRTTGGKPELFHGNDLGRDVPEHGAEPAVLDEDVDAESRDVAQFK